MVDSGSEDHLPNSDKPKFENKFADILRGYGVKEQVINKFLEQDINFSDVAALDEKDLELMGIRDAEIRKSLLSDFEKTRHQANHFSRFRSQKDVDEYRETVYRNTAKQTLAISCTLQNMNIHLEKQPLTDNYLVDDVYLSQLTLNALEEMKAVLEMFPGRKDQPISQKVISKIRRNWKSLATIGTVGAAIAIIACKWIKQ